MNDDLERACLPTTLQCAVGEGLLACTLARAEWTHEAHLAACCWLLLEPSNIVPERDLPDIIAGSTRASAA